MNLEVCLTLLERKAFALIVQIFRGDPEGLQFFLLLFLSVFDKRHLYSQEVQAELYFSSSSRWTNHCYGTARNIQYFLAKHIELCNLKTKKQVIVRLEESFF